MKRSRACRRAPLSNEKVCERFDGLPSYLPKVAIAVSMIAANQKDEHKVSRNPAGRAILLYFRH